MAVGLATSAVFVPKILPVVLATLVGAPNRLVPFELNMPVCSGLCAGTTLLLVITTFDTFKSRAAAIVVVVVLVAVVLVVVTMDCVVVVTCCVDCTGAFGALVASGFEIGTLKTGWLIGGAEKIDVISEVAANGDVVACGFKAANRFGSGFVVGFAAT